MKNDRTLLKVFGIFSIILGVLNLAVIFGGAEPVYAYIIGGAFNILLGVSLLVAAKDPARAGFATVLAWVDLLLNALSIVLSLLSGTLSVSAIVNLLFSLIVVLALIRLKKGQ